MARLGTAYCYQCGTPIRQQSPEEIKEELLRLPPGTKAFAEFYSNPGEVWSDEARARFRAAREKMST